MVGKRARDDGDDGGLRTHGKPKIGSTEKDDSAMPTEKYCINNKGCAALFSFCLW